MATAAASASATRCPNFRAAMSPRATPSYGAAARPGRCRGRRRAAAGPSRWRGRSRRRGTVAAVAPAHGAERRRDQREEAAWHRVIVAGGM